MEAHCSVCSTATPKLALHAVGRRAMCRPCFLSLRRGPRTPEPTRKSIAFVEQRSLGRLDLVLTAVAIAAKAGLFVALFAWANASPLGEATLHGVVAADLLTWILFTFLDWPFRPLQIGLGLGFELVLLVVYLAQFQAFDMPQDAEAAGIGLLAALLYVGVKTAIWGAETAMELSGVKE